MRIVQSASARRPINPVEIQTAVMQQALVAEQVRIEQVEKAEQQVKAEAEIAHALKNGAHRHPADRCPGSRRRRSSPSPRPTSFATSWRPQSGCRGHPASGARPADAIRKRGEAEGGVVMDRAPRPTARCHPRGGDADRSFHDARETARVIAAPLRKIDKLTVVSTDGSGARAG